MYKTASSAVVLDTVSILVNTHPRCTARTRLPNYQGRNLWFAASLVLWKFKQTIRSSHSKIQHVPPCIYPSPMPENMPKSRETFKIYRALLQLENPSVALKWFQSPRFAGYVVKYRNEPFLMLLALVCKHAEELSKRLQMCWPYPRMTTESEG